MNTRQAIRIAHSCAIEARQAVREFHAGVAQRDLALVVFFCSSEYDLNALAGELNVLFGDVPLIGCTTAGEIGPAGYRSHSLSGVSFAAPVCRAVTGCLPALRDFEISQGQALARELLQKIDREAATTAAHRTFAFLLIDGLSVREEPVVRTLQSALGSIPLCGGSAGDDLRFARTWIFYQGTFRTDAAALVLVNTPLPFRLFKTQHFVSEQERLVVTEADVARRVVKEINGLPAAEEYARVIGVTPAELTPTRFANSPVVVVIDGTDYVRSIQKANPDGSLTFYCAIDEGLVLRVARGADLVTDLERTFDQLREEIGPPGVTFGCDCILRNLEITQKDQKTAVGEVLQRNHTVGFSTYGEQYGGVHVNQTFTGIAIGGPRDHGAA